MRPEVLAYLCKRKGFGKGKPKPPVICEWEDNFDNMNAWEKSRYYTYSFESMLPYCIIAPVNGKVAFPRYYNIYIDWHTGSVYRYCQAVEGYIELDVAFGGETYEEAEDKMRCMERWHDCNELPCIHVDLHVIFWENENGFGIWDMTVVDGDFHFGNILILDKDKNVVTSGPDYGITDYFHLDEILTLYLYTTDAGDRYYITYGVKAPFQEEITIDIPKQDIPFNVKGKWGMAMRSAYSTYEKDRCFCVFDRVYLNLTP